MLIFAIFKGLEIYSTFTTAEIALNCGNEDEARRVSKFGTENEKKAYFYQFYSCVNKKQNFIQKAFYKFPTQN